MIGGNTSDMIVARALAGHLDAKNGGGLPDLKNVIDFLAECEVWGHFVEKLFYRSIDIKWYEDDIYQLLMMSLIVWHNTLKATNENLRIVVRMEEIAEELDVDIQLWSVKALREFRRINLFNVSSDVPYETYHEQLVETKKVYNLVEHMAEKLATLSDLIEKQNAKIDKLTKEVTHLRNHNPRYQEDFDANHGEIDIFDNENDMMKEVHSLPDGYKQKDGKRNMKDKLLSTVFKVSKILTHGKILTQ